MDIYKASFLKGSAFDAFKLKPTHPILQEHARVTKNLDWLLKLLKPSICASHPSTVGPFFWHYLFLGLRLAISYVLSAATLCCHFRARTNAWRKQPQGLAFGQRLPKLPESEASRPESDSRTMTYKASTHLWLCLGRSANKAPRHIPDIPQPTSQTTLPELHSCQPQHSDWSGFAFSNIWAAPQSFLCIGGYLTTQNCYVCVAIAISLKVWKTLHVQKQIRSNVSSCRDTRMGNATVWLTTMQSFVENFAAISAISYVLSAATLCCHSKARTNAWRKQPQGLAFAQKAAKIARIRSF